MLDFIIIIMVMSCSLGPGAAFSAIPVAILQGSVTALAGLVRPVMTEAALNNLSLVGSVLIFCVGINLLWGKRYGLPICCPLSCWYSSVLCG